MNILKVIAYCIIGLYAAVILLLYLFQRKLIFVPGKLTDSADLNLAKNQEEVYIHTQDGERIHGLFCKGTRPEVILYFHGNAGDLSGWKFVTEDFTALGYNVLIIDYRGYGKSSGAISEQGFYQDGDAAYNYLVETKQFTPGNILLYGRSIGTGVAVNVASRHIAKGLILESPYTSLGALANEKLPFFFPSLYLQFQFDNLKKIAKVPYPVILLHGTDDELIPAAHSQRLLQAVPGKKKLILIDGGAHNDLSDFNAFKEFLQKDLQGYFK
jgi:fermentation-respiration switch protein FrsA (DUF1100 family)